MPFATPLSAPQETTLRTSGYWSRVLACLNPNEVVFRAQSTQSITTDPFITFTWDSADVGAYTDVWEGMVVFLSETTSIRDAKYRGRVRLAPSSTEFYISQNSETLNVGTYLIVVRDIDLFSRIRRDTLVDGSIAYHGLPDVLDGLPSAIVLYDADNDGSVSYTTVQTPVHVDVLSTSTDTWAWSVSGGGASSIDNPAIQNPTITFEAGYHYLLRVRHTNNVGTINYQISHVYAVTRTFGAPVVQPVITGSIGGDLEDGWTASLTAYGDVSTLIDRTHCVVWHVQHFGDDSSTPMVSNVLMNGRIRSDSIQTAGSAEAGQLQQVTFSVEGVTAYLRRLRIPNDIVRPTASPDEWGEITEPNPYRMAVYALWVYTTLTNIGSFGVETGAFGLWQIGGEPRGIEGGTALDVLISTLDTIRAAPNYAPSGELFLARTVSYQIDRDDVPLIATLTLSDMREYTIDRDSSQTTSQVVAFGGVYDSTTGAFILYTSQSPSIIYLEGETRELTRELLQTDSTTAEAQEELSSRSSNDYAYHNPKPLARLTLFDSWSGVLIPVNFQRWGMIVPASSNTLGIGYGETEYWQLQSVSLTINTDGSIDTSAEFPAETSFDDAQVLASLLPINLSNLNPVLPVLPNDPAFPTDPLELYPTDTPEIEDLQPINSDSAAQSYTPFPPDTASQMARRQGKAGSIPLQFLFSNPSNTASSKVSALGTDYLMSAFGSAVIDDGLAPPTDFDFSASDQGFAGLYGLGNDYAEYETGVGWGRGDFNFRIAIATTFIGTITGVSLTFDTSFTGDFNVLDATGTQGFGTVYSRSGVTWTVTGLNLTNGVGFNIFDPLAGNTVPSTLRLIYVVLQVAGTGVVIWADPFYTFSKDGDGMPINVQAIPGDEGLFIDNTRYSPVPPWSPNNAYSGLPFAGTNSVINGRMQWDDYTDKDDLYVYLDFTRVP